MKHVVDYVESGRPVIGMRTATHAFNLKAGKTYAEYSWNSKEWDGGFGRQVLGETWVNHHGEPRQAEHPRASSPRARRATRSSAGSRTATSGARPTSTASACPLPGDSKPLVLGQVARGHEARPTSRSTGKKNDPMMPVAWVKTYTGKSGKTARVFTTTMGASHRPGQSEGIRRLLVNACYWAVGLEDKIPRAERRGPRRQIQPLPFGFGAFKKGVRPADLAGE